MAESRLIQKQLAGKEDLLLGVGKVKQGRDSGIKTITKLNATHFGGVLVVDTINDLNSLDTSMVDNPVVFVKETGATYWLDNGVYKVKRPLEALPAYTKSIVSELPLVFSGYGSALAMTDGTYLYPQGFCYSPDGRVFIKYNADSGSTYSFIVVYDTSGAQLTWFAVSVGGESLVIRQESGGLYLYNRLAPSKLFRYDITTLPSDGSIITGVDVGITSVGLQYAYGDGKWIIEQVGPDVGTTGSRTKWNIYDENFLKTGEFYVPINVVGFQIPSSEGYPFIPKTQGVAIWGDKVCFGTGGSYIPANAGPSSPAVADFGVAEVNFDGSLSRYGVVRADALISRLADKGFTIERSESEGVTVHPDGSLHHLFISLRPAHSASTSAGIIIFKEFDSEGEDYSDIASSYCPFNLSRLSSGVFPRGVNGGIFNPFSGKQFTDMNSVCRFIVDYQIPRVSWYTTSVALTPIAGVSLPKGSLVTIYNANNLTLCIEVASTSAYAGIARYYANSSSGVYSATLMSSKGKYSYVDYLHFGSISDDLPGRLLKKHIDGGADILALQQGSTEGGNLLAIGGSPLYRAPTRIRMYLAETTTETVGTFAMEFLPTQTVPGTDNSVQLGRSDRRYSQVFAATGAINTSDAREKTFSSIPEVEKQVAIELKGLMKRFKFNDAIETKGEDKARIHYGTSAQEVISVFEKYGLDAMQYAMVCYDEWEEKEEVKDDEEGNIIQEYIPAGNRYGIRYEELLCFIISAM